MLRGQEGLCALALPGACGPEGNRLGQQEPSGPGKGVWGAESGKGPLRKDPQSDAAWPAARAQPRALPPGARSLGFLGFLAPQPLSRLTKPPASKPCFAQNAWLCLGLGGARRQSSAH